MGFGVGFGSPFGGSPLVPTPSPVSSIGDDAPVTFDFTDESNGPLPGNWEFYVVEDDGAGTVVGSLEPDPNTYFRIKDGLGLWNYTRQPATGAPFQERGVSASPLGVLQGRNAELAVAFVPPPMLLDASQDQLFVEVLAGLRTSDNGATFVGARVRAEWVGGTWVTPIAFEVVVGAMDTPTVLAAAVFDYANPIDPWCAGQLAEVRVELRGKRLVAVLSGAQAELVVDPVPIDESARPLVSVRVYNRLGTVFSAPPSVAGIQLRTLRDEERLGPAPCITKHEQLESPLLPFARLPLRELETDGFVKQTGPRAFIVTRDVEINEAGVLYRFTAGTILRVTEPVQNQTLMPVVPDLAHIRGLKEKAGK